MPNYEIVGLYDCPWYAKAEALSVELTKKYPIVEFKRTMMDSFQWKNFIAKMKDCRGWEITKSPIIWKVLVEPYGKCSLIGGINDFCEYVQAYYHLVFDLTTFTIKNLVKHNSILFAKGFHGQDRPDKNICNIALMNGSVRLIESILVQLLSPLSIASPNILFHIVLYNETMNQKEIEGLCLETIDLCSASLFSINGGVSLAETMYNAHLIIILDDLRKKMEESNSEWLHRIEWKLLNYADALNDVASDHCRILIGGKGPLCYMAEVLYHAVSRKKVGSGHLVTIGQNVVTQAKALIGRKTDLPPGSIGRLHAYGWPGSVGTYVEVRHAVVKECIGSIQGPQPCEIPIAEIGLNPNWLFNTFHKEFLEVQKSQIELPSSSDMKKGSPSLNSDHSQAQAVVNLLHAWLYSTSRIYGPIPKFDRGEICCPDYLKPENANISPASPVLPVISAGIRVSKKSSFPRGTFMVQPAICYEGKWISAGIVSFGTQPKILEEVDALWKLRQNLIIKDVNIKGVISSYDLDLKIENKMDSRSEIEQLAEQNAIDTINDQFQDDLKIEEPENLTEDEED